MSRIYQMLKFIVCNIIFIDIEIDREKETEGGGWRQRDRDVYRQEGSRERDKQTDRHINSETDGQTERERQTDKKVPGVSGRSAQGQSFLVYV